MDALSLSGEKRGLFSELFLILQTWSDETQSYETSLQNVYDLFIKQSDLKQVLEASSLYPASGLAISNYLSSQLLLYRPRSELIPMDQIESLLTYLSQFRTIANQVFGDLVCQTLSYAENGAQQDIAQRLASMDSRALSDENEMHSIAEVMGGFNFMHDESSLNTFVATHVRDYLVDTGFKQSKFHQIFVSANEHACVWGTPNYFLVKTQDNVRSTGYQPDW